MSEGRGDRGSPGHEPDPTAGDRAEPTSSGSSGGGGRSSGGQTSPRIGRRTEPGSAAQGGTGSGSGASRSGSGAPRPANRPRPGSLRSAGSKPAGGRGGTARRAAERPPGSGDSDPSEGRRRPVGIFGAFRGDSLFPKLGETLGVALRAVLGSPVLVAGPMLLVLVLWLALVAIGLDHVPQLFQLLLAIPPLSSLFDLALAITVWGQEPTAYVFILVGTAIRAVLWSVLVSLVVERLDTGRCSMKGVRRGLRSSPSVLGVVYAGAALLFFGLQAQLLLGSLGGFVFVGALVGGVYFLSFAPVIVIRDRAPAREALGQSVRASRLPGSRHVGLVMLYFFLAYFAFSFIPGGALVLNPSVQTWSLVLASSVFHMVVLAAFAYRYGVVEDDVPPPRPRPQRQPIFGGTRRR